ncbi:LOW QUALITY PROTEIN: protein CutA [Phasianus colchicus]|uniref:LOW QUALITY PROTEIN: protein CutA n=2 Tax=Phasianidae TaxID=9005 RepID=UPI00129DE914|nr:LOW QUALITY PROTEIN: protein CutA [Phasianus colchicus]
MTPCGRQAGRQAAGQRRRSLWAAVPGSLPSAGRAGGGSGTQLSPGRGMEALGPRCPLPTAQGCPRPGCRTVLLAMTLSLLMYPMLRSLALQLHSAITGSYVSGTHSIVFINCLNEQIAKDIARGIMDKKLAAYVNILPKSSALYFWKGELEESTEILLLVKTRTSKISELSNYVRSIHPFEIPEVISLPIDQGNPLYLKWIGENVPRD